MNKTNGKSATAVVADECPTCVSDYSVDCSVATFQALSDLTVGIFDCTYFCLTMCFKVKSYISGMGVY